MSINVCSARCPLPGAVNGLERMETARRVRESGVWTTLQVADYCGNVPEIIRTDLVSAVACKTLYANNIPYAGQVTVQDSGLSFCAILIEPE